MEVQFDNDKRGSNIPKTRIYAPTHRNYSVVELEEEDSPKAVVVPQPDIEQNPDELVVQKQPWPLSSKVLLILAIFTMAGTALLGLKGSSDITKIYGEIADIDEQIASYEELISQAVNDQGALNDYTSINEANIEAGRTMNWGEDSDNGDDPNNSADPQE